MSLTTLSVNVNKLATLRNSRGKHNPDVLKTTLDIVAYGAQGITVHPRPDARHIRTEDVYAIAEHIAVEFNIEGYPDTQFLHLVTDVKPAQCTLVPDSPEVLTSNAGWQVANHVAWLRDVICELHEHHIRTSLFIDPFQMTSQELDALLRTGTDRIELYTEAYADTFGTDRAAETLAIYKKIAMEVHAAGIEINAGHDLNLHNLKHFVREIPCIQEVSIGHALICDALYLGLEKTVAQYLACLQVDTAS